MYIFIFYCVITYIIICTITFTAIINKYRNKKKKKLCKNKKKNKIIINDIDQFIKHAIRDYVKKIHFAVFLGEFELQY